MVKLVVEVIPPVYLCCDTLITAADVASASRFQNDSRRREHLAWRRIVRGELGRNTTIEYNEVGAPVVDTPNIHISVAHGGGMVAVAFAEERVGVDIEALDRNFDRIKERYMTPQEATLSDSDTWAAQVWAAKEAIYKLYGRREVELTGDIAITAYDASTSQLTATVRSTSHMVVRTQIIEDSVVVATATFK
jgi:phosphopantetheinyl transferase